MRLITDLLAILFYELCAVSPLWFLRSIFVTLFTQYIVLGYYSHSLLYWQFIKFWSCFQSWNYQYSLNNFYLHVNSVLWSESWMMSFFILLYGSHFKNCWTFSFAYTLSTLVYFGRYVKKISNELSGKFLEKHFHYTASNRIKWFPESWTLVFPSKQWQLENSSRLCWMVTLQNWITFFGGVCKRQCLIVIVEATNAIEIHPLFYAGFAALPGSLHLCW